MRVSARRSWADHPKAGRGCLLSFGPLLPQRLHRARRFRLRTPGVYVIPSRFYHADPAPIPSLSHSIARVILDSSPMHARWKHPRLTPEPPPKHEPTKSMDDGTILHKLILGRGEDFEIIDAADWRTNAAKAAFKAARAIGKVPVLAHHLESLMACANAVLAQMRAHPACAEFFEPGQSEATMLWREGPVWCRSLVDRIPDREGAPLYDLKSTQRSAAPEEFGRTLERMYATQNAFYSRGAQAVLPGPPREFRFIVFETSAPFAVSVLVCGASLLEIAERDIKRAVMSFAKCQILGDWPGYRNDVAVIEASPYAMAKVAELSLST
jgi:hypothetical protein